MTAHNLCDEIRSTKEFFDRSTRCFAEDDSVYTPAPGAYTVCQHIAHTAQTLEWFVDGAWSPKGLSEDFEAMDAEVRKITSLADARAWMDRATAHAIAVLEKKSLNELMLPIAPGIMGGMPAASIVGAIVDHTAHHRGALTVYARLLGKKAAMPYMEMPEA